MDWSMIGSIVQKHGIGVALSLVMALITILLIRFVISQWGKLLDRQERVDIRYDKERQAMQMIMDGYLATLKEHSNDAKQRYKTTDEAHKYQREEHVKMMEGITLSISTLNLTSQSLTNAVDGFKESHRQRAKESEAIVNGMKDIADHCVKCGNILSGLRKA